MRERGVIGVGFKNAAGEIQFEYGVLLLLRLGLVARSRAMGDRGSQLVRRLARGGGRIKKKCCEAKLYVVEDKE